MSKFSDYINSEDSNEVGASLDKNDYKDMIDKYSKLSSSELMQEFIKLTVKEKSAGRLNDAELNGITETIKPYLNGEQIDKLDTVINMVRDVK